MAMPRPNLEPAQHPSQGLHPSLAAVSSTATPQKLGPSSVKLPIAQCPRTPMHLQHLQSLPKALHLSSRLVCGSASSVASQQRPLRHRRWQYVQQVRGTRAEDAFNPDLEAGIGSKSVGGVKASRVWHGPYEQRALRQRPPDRFTRRRHPASYPYEERIGHPEDTAAEEWSKKLGLGALAGASAARTQRSMEAHGRNSRPAGSSDSKEAMEGRRRFAKLFG